LDNLTDIYFCLDIDRELLKAALIDHEGEDADLEKEKDNEGLAESSILADICDEKVLRAFVVAAVGKLGNRKATFNEKKKSLEFFGLFEDLEEKISKILREGKIFHLYWVYLLSRHRIEEAAFNLQSLRGSDLRPEGTALLSAFKALLAPQNPTN